MGVSYITFVDISFFSTMLNRIRKAPRLNVNKVYPNIRIRMQSNQRYYEQVGNKLNPHTYFYRVLAIPFIKFCSVMIGTFYSMKGIWWLLEYENEEDQEAIKDYVKKV